MASSNFGIPDPHNVDLDDISNNAEKLRAVTCYISQSGNEYNGDIGVRVSALFVILIVSSIVTFFPVAATRVKRLHIPLYVYLFARYFGAGVIVATAFIHLLDPAYSEIGPQTCVGSTIGWRGYSWPPAIALSSAMLTFLMDFYAERYVDKKYALPHTAESTIDNSDSRIRTGSIDAATERYEVSSRHTHQHLHSGDQDRVIDQAPTPIQQDAVESKDVESGQTEHDAESIQHMKERAAELAFKQQISAFLILEFGVLFHSVIIGLTLATAGAEFSALYPVLVFHQSFEGLGIGARLSAIPFPKRLSWLPWWLCAGYGLTTPIAIAIGLGVRTTYNANSFTANVVSGVLDSISAGILMYTGFVELIARDFLFNPDRTDDDRQLAFMVVSLFLGAAIMALIGKWA